MPKPEWQSEWGSELAFLPTRHILHTAIPIRTDITDMDILTIRIPTPIPTRTMGSVSHSATEVDTTADIVAVTTGIGEATDTGAATAIAAVTAAQFGQVGADIAAARFVVAAAVAVNYHARVY